jgi:hypothetical protein
LEYLWFSNPNEFILASVNVEKVDFILRRRVRVGLENQLDKCLSKWAAAACWGFDLARGRAAIAPLRVSVITLFHFLHETVSTNSEFALVCAGVVVARVPIVALLVRLLNTIPTTRSGTSTLVCARVVVDVVSVVTFLSSFDDSVSTYRLGWGFWR